MKNIENNDQKRSSDTTIWKLLYFCWFIIIFRPEWFLSHYISAFKILRFLPTLMILALSAYWLVSPFKKDLYRRFGFFLIIVLISSFLAQNTGRSRIVLRSLTELYLIGVVTFSVVTDRQKADKIINLYLFHFLFIGLGGIYIFISSGRAIVPWDWVVAEENAFGSLMCIGLSFSLFYALSQPKGFLRNIAFLISFLSIIGVVISFARGAFIALIAVMFYFIYTFKVRAKSVFIMIGLGMVMFYASSFFFPENAFWSEMKTITEGTESGTGHDRKVLWSLAWEEFKDNPILGVGPYNFGVVSERYLHKVKDKGHYRVGTMYGRALHNGFFEILCELGILGMIFFLGILIEFRRDNKKIGYFDKKGISKYIFKIDPNYLQKGIECSMIAFLLTAFLYEIIFYNWMWVLLIINRMYANVTILEQNVNSQ